MLRFYKQSRKLGWKQKRKFERIAIFLYTSTVRTYFNHSVNKLVFKFV